MMQILVLSVPAETAAIRQRGNLQVGDKIIRSTTSALVTDHLPQPSQGAEGPDINKK